MPPAAAIRGADRVDAPRAAAIRFAIAGLRSSLLALRVLARSAGDGLPVFGYASAFAIVFGARLSRARRALLACARRSRRPRGGSSGRGLARGHEPLGGGTAAVNLGGRARRELVDDGRDRGHGRQLSRDRHLLDRPDATGRSVHQPGRAGAGRRRRDALAGRRRAVTTSPDVAAVDRFRGHRRAVRRYARFAWARATST